MENESIDHAAELKNRLINHLDDLREFARLPAEERDEVINAVCDYIAENSAADAHKFFIGVEYFMRLSAINGAPDLYARTIERSDPDAEKPQRHIEKHIETRFSDSEPNRKDGEQYIVAESAMFINFGSGIRLDDRSLLIVADRERNGTLIEFPFNLGGQIAFRGSDALQKGRDRSIAGYEEFMNMVRKYFYFEEPDRLGELYDHANFCFFAGGSTKELTDALDKITFSDEIIE